MSKRLRILTIVLLTPILVAAAVYVINPFGVPNWDPRGRVFGVIPYRVPSASMEPTIKTGQVVIACTTAYLRSRPAKGDIVVYTTPEQPGTPWLKRVVAVAGDVVELEGTRFLLNGIPQVEPYIAPEHQYDSGTYVVPPHSVFLMGDNREHSMDSRHIGPIPESAVFARVCGGT